MGKFNPTKYIIVDYQIFKSMLKVHRTKWRNWNQNLIGSGMRRIYSSTIKRELANHHKHSPFINDLLSHSAIILEITNKKKAMLTRIKFGI